MAAIGPPLLPRLYRAAHCCARCEGLLTGFFEEVDVGESSSGAFAGGGSGDDGEGSNSTGTVMYVMAKLPPTNIAEKPIPSVPARGPLNMLDFDAICNLFEV